MMPLLKREHFGVLPDMFSLSFVIRGWTPKYDTEYALYVFPKGKKGPRGDPRGPRSNQQ